MSVYTRVSHDELKAFLNRYDVAPLVEHVGIRAGIENTNYFVTTTAQQFVLTLFEKHAPEELVYFLELMAHLAEHGVPSPHPVRARDGHYLQTLNNKPAALVQRLQGRSPDHPNQRQCAAIGDALARLHHAGASFTGHRQNDRGPHWWRKTSEHVLPLLSPDDAEILREELRFQGLYRFADLPRGVIHADLFRDNAMFEGDELTGIIDFYYACNDILLYDVAVTVNDWCSYPDASLDMPTTLVLLRAYHAKRPFTAIERGAWPVMLRAAALRFWLSRLYDLHFPRPGEITHIKNPDEYKNILLDRRANESFLQRNWV